MAKHALLVHQYLVSYLVIDAHDYITSNLLSVNRCTIASAVLGYLIAYEVSFSVDTHCIIII